MSIWYYFDREKVKNSIKTKILVYGSL